MKDISQLPFTKVKVKIPSPEPLFDLMEQETIRIITNDYEPRVTVSCIYLLPFSIVIKIKIMVASRYFSMYVFNASMEADKE